MRNIQRKIRTAEHCLARMTFHIHNTWAELSLCIPTACLYCLHTMTQLIPFHLSAEKDRHIGLCSLKENIFIGPFLINTFPQLPYLPAVKVL